MRGFFLDILREMETFVINVRHFEQFCGFLKTFSEKV
jgi:hypothetical protein